MNMNELVIASDDAVLLGVLVGRASRARSADHAIEALADALDGARIVDAAHAPQDLVRLGCTVRFAELPGEAVQAVAVVAPAEASAERGRISVLSPVGRALLGRRVGEVAVVELPAGGQRRLAVRGVQSARAAAAAGAGAGAREGAGAGDGH